MKNLLLEIYYFLLEKHGLQGWWPLIGCQRHKQVKTGSMSGYHPGDYRLPESREQIFEICIGAILTQNTGWHQVEKTLQNLYLEDYLNPEKIINIPIEKLKEMIKPSGYFNQKSKKIKIFTQYFQALSPNRIPSREEILALWGIGPETADSILLYAFKVPTFVIDAYTKRIFTNLGLINEKNTYHEIQRFFEKNLPADLVIYQEYHALIVEHAKRFYNKKGYYEGCPIFQNLTTISFPFPGKKG